MRAPTETALFAAAKRWDAAAVAAILAAAPGLLTATDPRGRMALHLACAVKPSAAGLAERDGTQTAAALLAAGADIEAGVPMDADEGDFRATPVWYAAARGENLALVRVLLARGADASPCLWAAVWRDDAVLLGASRREAAPEPHRPWRDAAVLCRAPQAPEDSRSPDRGRRRPFDPRPARPRRRRDRPRPPPAEGGRRAARSGAGTHLNPAVLRAAAGGVNVVASAVEAGPRR